MNKKIGIQNPSHKHILLTLIVVQILFGINYVISIEILKVIPPLLWASVRSILTAMILVMFVFVLGRPHPAPSYKFFVPLIFLSLFGTVINQAAFLKGLYLSTVTNSSVLNMLVPLFTLFIVTLRGHEKLTKRRIFGYGSALLGILLLLEIEKFSLSNKTLPGDFLILINCVSYAIFLSYGKKFLETYDRFWTTTWLFIFGSVGLGTLALPDWISFSWPLLHPSLPLYIFFSVVGMIIPAYLLSNWTLAHTHASRVALFAYIQPIVAAILAYFWLDEQITIRTLLSGTLIFFGIYLEFSRDRVAKKNTPFNDEKKVEKVL